MSKVPLLDKRHAILQAENLQDYRGQSEAANLGLGIEALAFGILDAMERVDSDAFKVC